MVNKEDKDILQLLQGGGNQERAFRMLVQRYQERLYWHIRRIVIHHDDTNDVIQNTLIKVYRNIAKFQGNSKLYTWLYRIATNESITFLNKKKRHRSSSLDDEETNLSNQLQADSYFDGDEAQRKLQLALKTLPEKQLVVFNMRYYDDMSYKDISEVLGTSVGGLKASYHHAVKKVERFFKEE